MEEKQENETEQKPAEELKDIIKNQYLEEEKTQEPPTPQNTDTKEEKTTEELSPVRINYNIQQINIYLYI